VTTPAVSVGRPRKAAPKWTDEQAPAATHGASKARAEGEWRHVRFAPTLNRLMPAAFWRWVCVACTGRCAGGGGVGIVAIWEVGGWLLPMRARLDAMPMLGASTGARHGRSGVFWSLVHV